MSYAGCLIQGCSRPTFSGGFCQTHYRRNLKGQDLAKPIQSKAGGLTRICVTLNAADLERLKSRAKLAGGLGVSAAIRILIADWLGEDD